MRPINIVNAELVRLYNKMKVETLTCQMAKSRETMNSITMLTAFPVFIRSATHNVDFIRVKSLPYVASHASDAFTIAYIIHTLDPHKLVACLCFFATKGGVQSYQLARLFRIVLYRIEVVPVIFVIEHVCPRWCTCSVERQPASEGFEASKSLIMR